MSEEVPALATNPSDPEGVYYARRHGIPFVMEQPKPRRPMGFGGNFVYNRRFGWTH